MRSTSVAVAIALWAGLPVMPEAQVPDSSMLTLTRIYGSPEFRPEPFGPAAWLGSGTAYTTLERSPETTAGRDLVRYDAATGERTVLVPAARLIPAGDTVPLEVESYSWSDDARRLLIFTNSRKVWRQNTRGDYWVLELGTWRLRKLGGRAARPSSLMFAKFAPGGGRAGYVRGNNLYVEDLATGRILQLTRDGSRTIINGTFDWVYEEELDDRDGWRWSPDGRSIAFWQLNADSVRSFDLINTTDSLYATVVPVQYPKAGESNSAARVGTVPAVGGPVTWFRVPGDPSNSYLARMEWAESSSEVMIQQLNRLQNTNTVYLGDRRTGAVREVLVEHDSAWVDLADSFTWLDGGRSFLWQSERDGWLHLYRVSRDGREMTLLTPGEWDIARVVAVDDRWVYYTASPDDPTQRYLWRSPLDGSVLPERVTPEGSPGTHVYVAAPKAGFAFHTYSKFGSPPVLDLIRLPGHEPLRVLSDNATLAARVARLQKGPMEFFQVDIGDGVKLNGWVMKPIDFSPNRKYPILFTNYGGPGSQTVLDQWGSSNYLWNLLLTQKGYLVASIDNRGTGMRGRAWRKIVYRQLGVVETQDQAAAARAIGRWSYVDSTRMGVFGWSYGGFMSLNGLFQAPDVYRMAISVAPVTHWKYYDNIYTERYNGLPRENADGYDRGSPLSYVERMRGQLLLVHGTGDDNVHYQNSEALINRLVAANKQFELMSYPNRDHGISGGMTSLHLRGRLTRFIDETLGPPVVRPQQGGQANLTN